MNGASCSYLFLSFACGLVQTAVAWAQFEVVYEFRATGPELEQVRGPSSIVIQDGVIYGFTEYPPPEFFSLNLDGSGFVAVPTSNLGLLGAGTPPIVGDTIFYATHGSQGLYRIQTDGTGNQAFQGPNGLIDLESQPVVVDEHVYGYSFRSPAPSLFRIGLDGENYENLYVPPHVLSSNVVTDERSLFGGSLARGLDSTTTTARLYAGALDGTNLSIIHEFSSEIESVRHLVLYDDTIIGVARAQDADFETRIFSIGTDGSDFSVLRDLDEQDTSLTPIQLLVLEDEIYGLGVSSDEEALFRMGLDGESFEVIHHFENGNGSRSWPNNDLTAVGDYLYGSTYLGGSSEDPAGTIYRYDTSSSPHAIPEPSSMTIWGILLLVATWAARRDSIST